MPQRTPVPKPAGSTSPHLSMEDRLQHSTTTHDPFRADWQWRPVRPACARRTIGFPAYREPRLSKDGHRTPAHQAIPSMEQWSGSTHGTEYQRGCKQIFPLCLDQGTSARCASTEKVQRGWNTMLAATVAQAHLPASPVGLPYGGSPGLAGRDCRAACRFHIWFGTGRAPATAARHGR